VERAFCAMPKILFVTKDLEDEAYTDSPLRVSTMGFNISAPHMYAMCLEKLQLEPGMTFLDVGSGCGMLTALAGFLVGPKGTADGLEIRQDIIRFALDNLKRLKDKTGIELPQVKFKLRNVFCADEDEKKYDRIHVGACCPESKLEYLFGLLNCNGRLVTPYGDKLILATKDSSGKVKVETITDVRYGDLVIPSEAEVMQAQLALERKRAVKLQVPPPSLSSELAQLVGNADLSDVTFVLDDGQKVPAHRTLLALRSATFRAMLAGRMKEATQQQIPLPGVPHAPFLLVLKYLYTDDVSFVDEKNTVELLEWANYFKCDRLKAQCEFVIHEGIDVENAASLISIADRFDARQLSNCVREFIFANFAAVSATAGFRELDRDVVTTIMATAVARMSKAAAAASSSGSS